MMDLQHEYPFLGVVGADREEAGSYDQLLHHHHLHPLAHHPHPFLDPPESERDDTPASSDGLRRSQHPSPLQLLGDAPPLPAQYLHAYHRLPSDTIPASSSPLPFRVHRTMHDAIGMPNAIHSTSSSFMHAGGSISGLPPSTSSSVLLSTPTPFPRSARSSASERHASDGLLMMSPPNTTSVTSLVAHASPGGGVGGITSSSAFDSLEFASAHTAAAAAAADTDSFRPFFFTFSPSPPAPGTTNMLHTQGPAPSAPAANQPPLMALNGAAISAIPSGPSGLAGHAPTSHAFSQVDAMQLHSHSGGINATSASRAPSSHITVPSVGGLLGSSLLSPLQQHLEQFETRHAPISNDVPSHSHMHLPHHHLRTHSHSLQRVPSLPHVVTARAIFSSPRPRRVVTATVIGERAASFSNSSSQTHTQPPILHVPRVLPSRSSALADAAAFKLDPLSAASSLAPSLASSPVPTTMEPHTTAPKTDHGPTDAMMPTTSPHGPSRLALAAAVMRAAAAATAASESSAASSTISSKDEPPPLENVRIARRPGTRTATGALKPDTRSRYTVDQDQDEDEDYEGTEDSHSSPSSDASSHGAANPSSSSPATSRAASVPGSRANYTKACSWPGCTARFPKESTLARHVRCHTGERPFACRVAGCNAAFSERGNLVRHAGSHADQRRFACPFAGYCQARFRRAAHVEQHVASRHIARGEDAARAYLYTAPPPDRDRDTRGRVRRAAAKATGGTASRGSARRPTTGARTSKAKGKAGAATQRSPSTILNDATSNSALLVMRESLNGGSVAASSRVRTSAFASPPAPTQHAHEKRTRGSLEAPSQIIKAEETLARSRSLGSKEDDEARTCMKQDDAPTADAPHTTLHLRFPSRVSSPQSPEAKRPRHESPQATMTQRAMRSGPTLGTTVFYDHRASINSGEA